MPNEQDVSGAMKLVSKFGDGVWFNDPPSPNLDKEVLLMDEVSVYKEGSSKFRVPAGRKFFEVRRKEYQDEKTQKKKPLARVLCSSSRQAKVAMEMSASEFEWWALHAPVKMSKHVDLTFSNGALTADRSVTCQGVYFWGLSDEYGSWITSMSASLGRPIELIRLLDEEEMLLVFSVLEKNLSSYRRGISTEELYRSAARRLAEYRTRRGVDVEIPRSLSRPAEPSRLIFSSDSEIYEEIKERREEERKRRLLESSLRNKRDPAPAETPKKEEPVQEKVDHTWLGGEPSDETLVSLDASNDPLDLVARFEEVENRRREAFQLLEDQNYGIEPEAADFDPFSDTETEADFDAKDAVEEDVTADEETSESHLEAKDGTESRDEYVGEESSSDEVAVEDETTTHEEGDIMSNQPEITHAFDPSEFRTWFNKSKSGNRVFSEEKNAYGIATSNKLRLAIVPPWWNGDERISSAVEAANAKGQIAFTPANGYKVHKDHETVLRPATANLMSTSPLFTADDTDISTVKHASVPNLESLAPLVAIIIEFLSSQNKDLSPASGPAYLVLDGERGPEVISVADCEDGVWENKDARLGVKIDLDDGSWTAWIGVDERGDAVMVTVPSRSRRVRSSVRSSGRDIFAMMIEHTNPMDGSGPTRVDGQPILGDVDACVVVPSETSSALALMLATHNFQDDFPEWNYRDGDDVWLSATEPVRKFAEKDTVGVKSVAKSAANIVATVRGEVEFYPEKLGPASCSVLYTFLRQAGWEYIESLEDGLTGAFGTNPDRSADLTESMDEREKTSIVDRFTWGDGIESPDVDSSHESERSSDVSDNENDSLDRDYGEVLYGENENFVEDWATRNDTAHPDDLFIGDEDRTSEPAKNQGEIRDELYAFADAIKGDGPRTESDYDYVIDIASALASAAETFSAEMLRAKKLRFGSES